jgi:hypothetical protein
LTGERRSQVDRRSNAAANIAAIAADRIKR